MIYRFLAVLAGLGIAYAIPLLIERHAGPLLVFADLEFRTPYCTFWQAVVTHGVERVYTDVVFFH